MELTKEDLVILIEAVEAWEHKDKTEAMTSSLLGIMLSKNKEEAHKCSEEAIAQGKNAYDEKTEIATCLKAKLILIKNKIN